MRTLSGFWSPHVAITRLARLAMMGACMSLANAAMGQGVTEVAVKAAFVFKFLGYVEWPTSAVTGDAPYVIGVAGADELAAELERMTASRSLNGRRITVKRWRDGDTTRGLHVLYVGRSQPNARELLLSIQRQPTLTVTEGDRGLEQGSIVNLVTLEDRVGFEVSLVAADRAGLAISSRMLAVARHVIPKP
jgi:hypothetical protein